MNIGPVFRAIRERKEMNLREFADLVNYDRSYVARVETGGRMPSLHYVSAVMEHAESRELFELLSLLGFPVDPLAVRVHTALQEDGRWTPQRRSAIRLGIEAMLRFRS